MHPNKHKQRGISVPTRQPSTQLAFIPVGVTPLTHVQCGVRQDSQLPGCQDAQYLGMGCFCPRSRTLYPSPLNFRRFCQLISQMAPLASRLALHCINHFFWVGVTCKLAKDALCLFDQTKMLNSSSSSAPSDASHPATWTCMGCIYLCDL